MTTKSPRICTCKDSKHRIIKVVSTTTTDAINHFKMHCTDCGATWTRKEY